MKHSLFTRLLSLILVMALLVPCFPQATAEEVTEPTAPETTAPSETLAEAETTEATEAASETIPATEAALATEAILAVEETQPPEPTEAPAPAALPYGLAGLPEGYTLDSSHARRRQNMLDMELDTAVTGLTPGQDYVPGEILISAQSEEEALIYAAAYNGQLKTWSHGIATITLTGLDAPEAVTLSLDDSLNLPVAAPNLIYRVDPIRSDLPQVASFSTEAPQKESWYSYVQGMSDPDEYLLIADDHSYQYMHDVVGSYPAWEISTGDYIRVAVIDTGVDTAHPDLRDVTVTDVGCGTEDLHGHGTHVAGIIGAALNNGIGGAGIAPNVSIHSYCVAQPDGKMFTEHIARAINDCAGINIINMSLGGPIYDPIFDEAIQKAVELGTTVVAAMGNEGTNARQFPAAYDNVIAVGATDQAGRRAYFSNFGPWCDLSAPGVGIMSTYPGGGYALMDGTSMACPVVSGVCALYMNARGSAVSPDEMLKALKSGCTKISGKDMGAGIVNISKMLGGKPERPFYTISQETTTLYTSDEPYKNQLLPYDAVLSLYTSDHDQSQFLLYTTDGKNPAVKNGEVIHGQRFDGLSPTISLAPYAGSTVTVKAMQVSGMGMAGPILTLKLKVDRSAPVTGVTVSGSKWLVSGKSAAFEATVEPAAYAPQGVTWMLEETIPGITINPKTGKLTAAKGTIGTVHVVAVSTADPQQKSLPFEVRIDSLNPVAKVTLSVSKFTMYKGDTQNLSVHLQDADENIISPYVSGVLWTSSNPRVATVDQNGTIQAIAKGKATITCKALDGSNKSAKCSITVHQQSTGLAITGSTAIAPGKSTTLKATLAPKDVSSKKVIWSIIGGPEGVTMKNGKVTVPKSVTSGTIKVQAASFDGYTSDTHEIVIQASATAVKLSAGYGTGYAQGGIYDSKGNLKSIELYSVDLQGYLSGKENQLQLSASCEGAEPDIVWTSSKPDVASVDESGKVTAHKAGTAKITAAAQDSGKKKATIPVKVINPASYLELTTTAPQMSSPYPVIAAGKSVSHKVVFGDTYGKPSSARVSWYFHVYEGHLDEDGTVVYDYFQDDVTDLFVNQKLISLKNGKLSVSKKAADMIAALDEDTEYLVQVWAEATDGTYASACKEYLLIRPTTIVQCIELPGKKIDRINDKDVPLAFVSDQEFLFGKAAGNFTVTSSKPDVISVNYIEYSNTDRCYYAYFATGRKPGTATIKVTASDGTRKGFSYKIKLVQP